jgi:hypothetical protein
LALALLASALWSIPTGDESVVGLATFMNPGRMEEVIEYRGRDISAFQGAVALNRAGDLYRTVWIEYDGKIYGPYISLSCAQREHYEARVDKDRVVEVDWETAQSWGMKGPVPVKVYFGLPEGLTDRIMT